jgi:hypothetical protein
MLPLFIRFGVFRLQTGRIFLLPYIFIIPFCRLVLLGRLLSESCYLQTVRELNPIATLEFHAQENCERLRYKLDKVKYSELQKDPVGSETQLALGSPWQNMSRDSPEPNVHLGRARTQLSVSKTHFTNFDIQIDFNDLAISVRYMNTIFSLDRTTKLWLYEPSVQRPFHQFLALAPCSLSLGPDYSSYKIPPKLILILPDQ